MSKKIEIEENIMIYNVKDENNDAMIQDKYDEIYNLEVIQEKMENDIKELWNNVILPYLESTTQKKILNKLNSFDYDKFYKFMIGNNNSYNLVNDRLKQLKYD